MCMDGDLIGGVMRGVMRGAVGYLFPNGIKCLRNRISSVVVRPVPKVAPPSTASFAVRSCRSVPRGT